MKKFLKIKNQIIKNLFLTDLKKKIYKYSALIMNGEFIINVEINGNNELKTKVIEKETKEPYILHLTDAKGTFVGKIRDEYCRVLKDIAKNSLI